MVWSYPDYWNFRRFMHAINKQMQTSRIKGLTLNARRTEAAFDSRELLSRVSLSQREL